MKKSMVAVGVIVALGVIWAGSAWYTGKQLESQMDDMLAQANDQLTRSAPQAGLALSYQNYQRGWFTSRLNVVVSPKTGVSASWLKPGESIVFNERVDHGPFPLMMLKKFNLVPALGAINTTLDNTPKTAQLFNAAAGKQPIELQTRIGYGGATDSWLTLTPLNISSPQGKLVTGGGKFTMSADDKQQDITFSGHIDNVLFNTLNRYGQQVQLSTGKLTTEGDTSLSAFDARVGKQSLTLDKLAMAVAGKEMAVLEGVKLDANSGVEADGKHLNGKLDYSVDALKLQNRNLGSGQLVLTVSQLDGDAVRQFRQALEQQQQAMVSDPALANNAQLQQQRAIEIITDNLPLLLKGGPKISIAPLSWKNDKGEATLNLALALKEPGNQPVAAAALQDKVGYIVNSLDMTLNIPIDVASAFMTQIAQLEGYQESDAQKLAEQQVKGVSALGQMFQVTTEKDGAIHTQLSYANNQITLNGRSMSLDELLNKYTLPAGLIPDSPAPTLDQ